jgi:hypothetical protein
MSYTTLAQNVFVQFVDGALPTIEASAIPNTNEGIITDVSQFISLLAEVILSSKDIYNIPDTNVIIPMENFPRELVWKLNHGTSDITEDSKKQITIVTYNASELPEQVSAHGAYQTSGIRNIKPRLIDVYPDPDYDGYSIALLGKNIEATIDLQVWGLEDKGIRDRSKLLRQIIRDNIWYFKQKGLKEIIWLGASESDRVDKQNIVQVKKESYRIVFTEIQKLRQKNIEQVLVLLGLEK